MSADDREVMNTFVNSREPHHLAQLYERHHQHVLRFLQRLTRERAMAEDIAQQTWIKVMDAAARRQYTPGAATFKSFLLRLARNTFLDECTRKHAEARRQVLTEGEFERAVTHRGVQDCPESVTQGTQSRSMLQAALAALPPEQREVLRWWSAGESIAAMATLTRAPRDTVLSRKKYALARLRHSLERSGATAMSF